MHKNGNIKNIKSNFHIRKINTYKSFNLKIKVSGYKEHGFNGRAILNFIKQMLSACFIFEIDRNALGFHVLTFCDKLSLKLQ